MNKCPVAKAIRGAPSASRLLPGCGGDVTLVDFVIKRGELVWSGDVVCLGRARGVVWACAESKRHGFVVFVKREKVRELEVWPVSNFNIVTSGTDRPKATGRGLAAVRRVLARENVMEKSKSDEEMAPGAKRRKKGVNKESSALQIKA